VNVVLVKNCQSLRAGEARLAKRRDQRGKFIGREMRPWQHGQLSKIQQSADNPAFSTRVRQLLQRPFTGLKIEVRVCVEADELTGSDDLQFYWHG
jgi:hypothetical protein